MGFKKLALVTAIAAAPLSAFAMEEVTDSALADVSGQDGISLTLGIGAAGIATDIYLHDKDGLTGFVGASSAYSFDAAIVVDDMRIAVGGANIVITVDAGDNVATNVTIGATSAILNVNVALPAALTITTGAIRVANSQRDNANGWSVDTMSANILNTMTIILGGTTLNIQLGNEAQTGAMAGTDMIVISAAVTGGIVVNAFKLADASSGAGIGASQITMLDTGGTGDLNLKVDINATNAGLVVGLGQLGHATNGMTINMGDQYLGTSTNAKLGDVSIVGLNLNGSTLTINGK